MQPAVSALWAKSLPFRFFLPMVAFVGIAACGAANEWAAEDEPQAKLSTQSDGLTSLPADKALHAQGSKIVDAKGQEVHLRGTNLGGWLVLENWMCGITDSIDKTQNNSIRGRYALNTLEERFGTEKADELINAWQDHFITSSDFDRLKALGVNVVRIPFWWRNLQAADKTWHRDAHNNIDFHRMDWAIDQAARRGMWVIPVFHIWFGQKTEYSRISGTSRQASSDRQYASSIWRVVAKHYKGNPTIAAFDLINEPTGSPGNVLQSALYQAVRDKDPDRMIMMESVGANPKSENWTNVVYSFHEYNCMGDDEGHNKTALQQDTHNTFDKWQQFPVPVNIGEFMAQPESHNDTLDLLLKQFNSKGYSWINWMYKGVDNGNWAFYNHPGSMRVNVNTDSYDHILQTWSKMGAPVANNTVINRYKQYWSR